MTIDERLTKVERALDEIDSLANQGSGFVASLSTTDRMASMQFIKIGQIARSHAQALSNLRDDIEHKLDVAGGPDE